MENVFVEKKSEENSEKVEVWFFIVLETIKYSLKKWSKKYRKQMEVVFKTQKIVKENVINIILMIR